ncbi:kinesin-like protein kif3a [Chrysochromulina tobinii]|uniref:Kinesin-like protein kif3a n=1 Tax=Chrysochromulina tobinii TaxID=1460289 RepID=A0A0M0LP12_9EUKA|nr:kinesin-like protein kif3a [Chrysochromulina tobinii]|eukprot:KOO52815.1 kinesin-like protein kif3a [Chrysochromulina sp. CCMP291]
MNRTSSRSHALLLLRVEQWTESTDEAAADLAAIQTGDEALSDRSSVVSASAPRIAVRRGLLSIVDLAGSERVCKSGSEGVRLEEAKRINKSIAALGNCIAALSSGNGKGTSHVPFRDSKLTRLLTDSLGGNTKTALCAAIGPALHNYDETFCTLLLATRARVVRNYARINERIERETNAAPERLALLAQMRALQTERFEHGVSDTGAVAMASAMASASGGSGGAGAHGGVGAMFPSGATPLSARSTSAALQARLQRRPLALSGLNSLIGAMGGNGHAGLSGAVSGAGEQPFDVERSADVAGAVPGEADAEADVVLDQLVSGLLATPCIRRRLDQLYGRAAPSQRSWQTPSSQTPSQMPSPDRREVR